MTNIVKKEVIHTNEAEAIQQSKNGEAKYLGLFTDTRGQWINKKLYKKGRLVLNEIINLSNSIVL